MHYLCSVAVLLIANVIDLSSAIYRNKNYIPREKPEAVAEYEKCPLRICQEVETYPDVAIVNVMTGKNFSDDFFGSYSSPDIEFESRMSNDIEQLCKTDGPHTYIPKVMRNVEGQYKFIVNVLKYKQTFTAEICQNVPDVAVRDYVGQVPITCKQNYQRLLLLTYENKQVEYDTFEVPTTCGCELC